MLTKDDLKQIQIIVRQEGKNIRSELRMEIKLLKMELSNRIAELERRLDKIEVDIDQMKKDIRKIRKDLNYSVDFIDREYLELKKRVDRIEGRLQLSV
jgi:SMC interacting uncharacterized protein involved in chromosome segregation